MATGRGRECLPRIRDALLVPAMGCCHAVLAAPRAKRKNVGLEKPLAVRVAMASLSRLDSGVSCGPRRSFCAALFRVLSSQLLDRQSGKYSDVAYENVADLYCCADRVADEVIAEATDIGARGN